jgi:hypothetical protein
MLEITWNTGMAGASGINIMSPKRVEIYRVEQLDFIFYQWTVRFADEKWPLMGSSMTFEGAMKNMNEMIEKGKVK